MGLGGEHGCCRKHRPKQTPPAHLIDTGDPLGIRGIAEEREGELIAPPGQRWNPPSDGCGGATAAAAGSTVIVDRFRLGSLNGGDRLGAGFG